MRALSSVSLAIMFLLKSTFSTLVDMTILEHIKLYDDSVVDTHCKNKIPGVFTKCQGKLSAVSVMIRQHEPKSHLVWVPGHTLLGEVRNASKGSYRPNFLGRIFKIDNAYITEYGHMFDDKYRYLSGRHTDDDRPNPAVYGIPTKVNVSNAEVGYYSEIVINAILPWGNVFGHQLMEYFQMLYMLRPVRDHSPNYIVLTRDNSIGRPEGKFYEIFLQMGLRKKQFMVDIVIPGYDSTVQFGKNVITTTSAYGIFVWNQYIRALNEAVDTLYPHWGKERAMHSTKGTRRRHNTIIIHDRRDMLARKLTQGTQIESALRKRYGSQGRNVRVFTGKESLYDTIELFRSGHGLYVEIQPKDFHHPVFLDVATTIGWEAYLHVAKTGNQQSNVDDVDLDDFLKNIFVLIDKQDVIAV